MSVGDVCNREVVVVDPSESISEAVRLMRELHVGALVVTEQRGAEKVPLGIVTDRDVVVEIMAAAVDPGAVTVADVMNPELVTVAEGADLFDAIETMRSHGVRRLPVVDGRGGLVGVLTVDDLIDLLAEALSGLAALIVREQREESKRRP